MRSEILLSTDNVYHLSMKPLTPLLVLLFAMLTSHSSYAQSPNQLHGTWTIDFEETLNIVPADRRMQYDTLNAEEQSQIQSQLLNQRFIFNADSSFLMGTNGCKFYDGSWILESNLLKLTFNQGSIIEYPLEFVNNEAKLTVVNDVTSAALFHQYYLKKSPTN